MQEHIYATSAGPLRVCTADNKITRAYFGDTKGLENYPESTIPKLIFSGTEFQIAVWKAVLTVPAGTTVTYQQLAQLIGRPMAHRAVANALGDNKIAYFIPCHRVIRKDGTLGGYRWGLDKKIALLRAEGYAA